MFSQASSAEDLDGAGSSESGSDSEDESSEEEVKEVVPPAKRKADSEVLSTSKKAKTEASDPNTAKNILFVGQLSWNVDEEWLTREFEKFGELSSVRIITDVATGRSRG